MELVGNAVKAAISGALNDPESSLCLLVCLCIYLRTYCPAALCCILAAFFSFFIFYTVDRTPWIGDQPVARPLPGHRTAQTQNKRTQTSMPREEFEPTIPGPEQAKPVNSLDRTATVIGTGKLY
jgi:hypothetical protein